ncbi:MAG: hypothetical protein IPO94_17520 [Saprospiraceae bacterium]|nr:hypothetical protein [Saprospiraceae bacterium]
MADFGMVDGKFDRMRFELVAEQKFNPDKRDFYTESYWMLQQIEFQVRKIQLLMIQRRNIVRWNMMQYLVKVAVGGENQDFFFYKIRRNTYDDSETGGAISNCFTSIGLLHKLRDKSIRWVLRWLPDDGKTLTEKKNFIKLGQRD